MSKTKPSALVDHLDRLDQKNDLAAFAALRRGLRGDPADDPHAHRYVLPFIGEAQGFRERVAYWVAALFASHRGSGTATLAQAFARVRRETESESIERRFIALLEADAEDLLPHLRHTVSLIKANKTRILLDWHRLHYDLVHWKHPNGFVRRQWSKDFWAPTYDDEATPTPTDRPITQGENS